MLPRVIFMGSPDFATPTLEELARSCEVVLVVTQPDRPAGRGRQAQPCAVKSLADSLSLPTFQPTSLRKLHVVAGLAAYQPDLIVVAAFGQILPQAVLDIPAKGCLNVHASLLPRWRGAAPIQAAILAGDDRTGVTIMQMEAGLDTGPILLQREVPLRPGTTASELSQQLAFLGAKALMEVLPSYLGGMLAPMAQNDSHSTYAPRLNKEDGLLDFSEPAQVLVRKVNAYHPWPGTFFLHNGRKLKVIEAHVHDTFSSERGERYVVNGLPAMGTSEGLLVLDRVQMEGKKILPGKDFLRGQADWV
ncbi:MAG TPA: methionyl-tRNA formyltransferase [Anaerolineaceae bacterium]|jgi:methionyl-tRNA formyltransferase|nr:methionyl-tRNA formyltransferase [Anaerolineaceae bacterium]HPT23830.1 methionyl-tRNA formyltransferase [Anaerolineaceae bacterium]